jgi:hypothetical protein
MKKFLCSTIACAAFVAIDAPAIAADVVPRVIGPPFASPPPACSPVASWTDVNANVCIKYVCEGGGFQIRCLPAPVLR